MGASGGRRGDVERWSQFHDDLAERLGRRPGGCRRPAGRPVRPLAGRPHRRRLPAWRIGRSPDLAVLLRRRRSTRRCRAGRRRSRRSLAQVAPTLRSRTASKGETLSRDPSVGGEDVGRSATASRPAPHGSAPRRSTEQARVRARARPDSAMPTLVLHGEDDRPRPADGVRGARDGPRRRAPHLSRACATSSTTSPRVRRSSTTSSPGSAPTSRAESSVLTDRVVPGHQPKNASGERAGAESVATATDPPNLIRLVPAKEAGRSNR